VTLEGAVVITRAQRTSWDCFQGRFNGVRREEGEKRVEPKEEGDVRVRNSQGGRRGRGLVL